MDLSTLIGKPFDAPEVQAFVKPLGLVEDDDEEYRVFRAGGISFRIEPRSHRINTIFVYADKISKYTGYKGPLPDGLNFGMDRDAVEQLLGPILLRTDRSSKWERGTHGLAVEFDKAGQIRMVVVTGV
ncbi:hypothetical protein LVJ94_17505 [Pendulispora rubella]|uniref:Uncharacterized protein n=1 Tax=Pendulispora rubella TaxID=2741070 RepID=A0ABZ2LGW4_9BACT